MILTGRRELRALRIAIFLQFRMQIARCRVHCNFGRTAAEKGKDRVLHTVLQFPPVYVFFLLSLSLSLSLSLFLKAARWILPVEQSCGPFSSFFLPRDDRLHALPARDPVRRLLVNFSVVFDD